jgi:hypothetical protein
MLDKIADLGRKGGTLESMRSEQVAYSLEEIRRYDGCSQGIILEVFVLHVGTDPGRELIQFRGSDTVVHARDCLYDNTIDIQIGWRVQSQDAFQDGIERDRAVRPVPTLDLHL